MKPQDLKDAPPHSSQTPEGASASDPTENLATHLEQSNREKGRNIPFSREKLHSVVKNYKTLLPV
ncbi:hypothetical protein [Bartonella queenslandensis]|uniref:hypothetical protein n=1 Tax=Bartonella queenslandensis TaxID=481138 RepID=UPI0002DA547A